MAKQMLLNGDKIGFRSSGHSLWPRVHSNDCCFYEPIPVNDDILLGDIVFCEVQPGNRFFAHVVLSQEFCYSNAKPFWLIGNIKNIVNGWCYREHIYGRVYLVLR